MIKKFKRLLSLALALLIMSSSTLPVLAGVTTDIVGEVGEAEFGRTGYAYRIGLGICSNDTYTGYGGDDEALAEWILDYGRRYYVHASGNPYYLAVPGEVAGKAPISPAGYLTVAGTPVNTAAPDTITELVNQIQTGGSLLDKSGDYSYIKPEAIPTVMEALAPTAPDLYDMWLTQKNSTNFHPVVIVVEAVILAKLPKGNYALDSYDLYNECPANVAMDGDLLTTDLTTFEPKGESLTADFILRRYGNNAYSSTYTWILFQYMFKLRPSATGPQVCPRGADGADIAIQDYYNVGGSKSTGRINGCYIINVGPAEVGELTGSYSWHINAQDIPNRNGYMEDGTADSGGVWSKSCTLTDFSLKQSNFGDWVAYFDQRGVGSVNLTLEIYHTGLSSGTSTFSTDYSTVVGSRSGALIANPYPSNTVSASMDAATFLKYLDPNNTSELYFPIFGSNTSGEYAIGDAPAGDTLANSFATKIEVTFDAAKPTTPVTLLNNQCHFAVYEKKPGKVYKYLQLLDDSSTQVKTSQLDDTSDPYEAMAGTPTTENLFITQGANQWVVNMQYRYAVDDYVRAYHIESPDTPNYMYYDVKAGDHGSSGVHTYTIRKASDKSDKSNTTDDTAGEYAYDDYSDWINNENTTKWNNARNDLVAFLESVQAGYDSNHSAGYLDGSACHYHTCNVAGGATSCGKCESTYDAIEALITELKGYTFTANSFSSKGPTSGTDTFWLFKTGSDADLDTELTGSVKMTVKFDTTTSHVADGSSKSWVTSYCTDATCGATHASGVSGATSDCPDYSTSETCATCTTASHSEFTHSTHTCNSSCKSIPSAGCPALAADLTHVCDDSCKTEPCADDGKNATCSVGSHTKTTHNHYGTQSSNRNHVSTSQFPGNVYHRDYTWSVVVEYSGAVTNIESGKRGKTLSEDTTLYQTFEDVKYMDIVDYHVWRLTGGIERGLGGILVSGDSSAVLNFACNTKGYTLYNAPQNQWGTFSEEPIGEGEDSMVWHTGASKTAGVLAMEGRLANYFSNGNPDVPTMTEGDTVDGLAWTPYVRAKTLDTVDLEYLPSEQGGRSHKSFDAFLKQALARTFYKSKTATDAYPNYIMVQSDYLTLNYGDDSDSGNLTMCGLHYNTKDYEDTAGENLKQFIFTTTSSEISQYYANSDGERYVKGDNSTAPQLNNSAGAPQDATQLKDLQEYAYREGIVPLNENDIYAEFTRESLNGMDDGTPAHNAINNEQATSFTNIQLKVEKSMPYIGLRSHENSHSKEGHKVFKDFTEQSYDPVATFVNGGFGGLTFGNWSTDSSELAAGFLVLDEGSVGATYFFPRSADDAYNVRRTLPNDTYATGYAATTFERALHTSVSEVGVLNAHELPSLSLHSGYIDCNNTLNGVANDYLTEHEGGIFHGSGYIGSKAPVNNVVIYNPLSAESARITLDVGLGSSASDDTYVTDGVTQSVAEDNLKVIRDQRVSPVVISATGEDSVLTTTKPVSLDLSERITTWLLRDESLYPTTYYKADVDYTSYKGEAFSIAKDGSPYTVSNAGSYYMRLRTGTDTYFEGIFDARVGDTLYFGNSGNTLWLQPNNAVTNYDYGKLYDAVRTYYINNPNADMEALQTAEMENLVAQYTEEYNAKYAIVEEYNANIASVNAKWNKVISEADTVRRTEVNNATHTYQVKLDNLTNTYTADCRTAERVYNQGVTVNNSRYNALISKATTTAEKNRLRNELNTILQQLRAEYNTKLNKYRDIYNASKTEAQYERDVTIDAINKEFEAFRIKSDASRAQELSTYYLDPAVTARIEELQAFLNNPEAPAMSLIVDSYLNTLVAGDGLMLPTGAVLNIGLNGVSLRAGAVVKLTLPVTYTTAPEVKFNTSGASDVVATSKYETDESGYLTYYIEFNKPVNLNSFSFECKSNTYIHNTSNLFNIEPTLLYYLNTSNNTFVEGNTINTTKDSAPTQSVCNNLFVRNVSGVRTAYADEVDFDTPGVAGTKCFYYIGDPSKFNLTEAAKANPHKVYNSNWRYYVVGWKTADGYTVESINSELLSNPDTLLVYPWISNPTQPSHCISVASLKGGNGVLVQFDNKVYLTTKDYVTSTDNKHYIAQTGKTPSNFDYLNLNDVTHKVNIDSAASGVYPLTAGLGADSAVLSASAVEFCFKLTDSDGCLYDVAKALSTKYRINQDDTSDVYLKALGFDYDAMQKVYKSGDTLLYGNYSLDWVKETRTVNQTPVISGDKVIYGSDFISLDDCFAIYWDNTGDIKGNSALDIAATQSTLGYGWNTGYDSLHVPNSLSDFVTWFNNADRGTDTSKWIKNKYVVFNFPVYVFRNSSDVIDPTQQPYYRDEYGNVRAAKAVRIEAGTPINLGTYVSSDESDNAGKFTDYGQPGVTKGDNYTYYFWCPVEVKEMTNATATCYIDAINQQSAAVYKNNRINNNTDGYTAYQKPTNARNNIMSAIVGRVGALTIVDSGDVNYSDTFKHSVNDAPDAKDTSYYNIYPLVKKIQMYSNMPLVYEGTFDTASNSGKQRMIVLDPFDVRGRLASSEMLTGVTYNNYLLTTGKSASLTEAYNTYGTQWFKNLRVEGANSGSMKNALPLASSMNRHEALRLTQQKLGYELYLSLESIGNYYGTSEIATDEHAIEETIEYVNDSGDQNQKKIQVRPVYFAYNAKYGNVSYTGPVDVYMVSNGTHVLINSGEVEDMRNPLKATYNSYYPYSIETNTGANVTTLDQNMKRRMVTKDEAIATNNVLELEDNSFTSLLSKFEESAELGESLMSNTYCYGNAQYMFLREHNRTFVGGFSNAVSMPEGASAVPASSYNLQAQKWYLGLGLPASVKFVPAGMNLTDSVVLTEGYVVSAVDIFAVGDVWSLHYQSPVSKMAYTMPDGSTIDGIEELMPEASSKVIAEFEWCIPVSIYDLKQSTSRDDLDTEGTH